MKYMVDESVLDADGLFSQPLDKVHTGSSRLCTKQVLGMELKRVIICSGRYNVKMPEQVSNSSFFFLPDHYYKMGGIS